MSLKIGSCYYFLAELIIMYMSIFCFIILFREISQNVWKLAYVFEIMTINVKVFQKSGLSSSYFLMLGLKLVCFSVENHVL
jgi:hypothetical protein